MKRSCALALIALMSAIPATAQDDSWKIEVTPYVWMAALEGDVTAGPLSVPLDVSFGDVLEDLEIAFIGHLEAHNDQWAVFTDVVYLELGRAQRNLDFDVTQLILEGGVGYRLSDSFEAIAGVRYWNLDTRVGRVIDPMLELESEKDWVDPIVGGRFLVPLSDKWALGLRGDLGGFGAGSEFSWNVAAFFNWQVSESVSLLGGYRALGVDYEDSDSAVAFKYDTTTHGPGIAASFQF